MMTEAILDTTFLIDLQGHVEVAVVFDGIAVGIEDGGVPISESLVAFLIVIWKTDVAAAGHVELHFVACQNDERDFGSMAVVGLTIFGEVEDDGVIEHAAISFRARFEILNQLVDDLHVVRSEMTANLQSRHSFQRFVVADFVKLDGILQHAIVAGAEVIESESGDIGKPGTE